MAVDIAKIKAAKEANEAKEAALSNRGGSIKRFSWGNRKEVKLRFMPPWTNEGEYSGQFWCEVAQHWGVSEDSKAPILCPNKTPLMEGGDCPICEFVDELRARKDDPEAQELAKDLRAKTAYLFTVIDRSDPEYTAKDVAEWKQSRPDKEVPFEPGSPKLQVYAAPFTVYNAIINVYINGGDIVDLESGRDVTVSKSGSGIKTKYNVVPSFTESPAGFDGEQKLLDLPNTSFRTSYADMKKALDEGIAGDYSAKHLPSGAAEAVANLSAGEYEGGVAEDEVDDLEAAMREGL